MLDPPDFVATCNSTLFVVAAARCGHRRARTAWAASPARPCCELPRGQHPAVEKQFSLTDVYGADEAFVAGRSPPGAGARGGWADDRRPGRRPAGDRPARELYAAAVADDVAAAESARPARTRGPLTVAEVVRLAVWSAPATSRRR